MVEVMESVPSVWACERYVVHHLMRYRTMLCTTDMRCAPLTCIVHHGAQGGPVLSVSVCVWICETYVVHHFMGTGLRCAPPTCVVHIFVCVFQSSITKALYIGGDTGGKWRLRHFHWNKTPWATPGEPLYTLMKKDETICLYKVYQPRHVITK